MSRLVRRAKSRKAIVETQLETVCFLLVKLKLIIFISGGCYLLWVLIIALSLSHDVSLLCFALLRTINVCVWYSIPFYCCFLCFCCVTFGQNEILIIPLNWCVRQTPQTFDSISCTCNFNDPILHLFWSNYTHFYTIKQYRCCCTFT